MKGFTSLLAGLVLSGVISVGASDSKDDSAKLIKLLQTSTVSLLKEGNARFVSGKPQYPNAEPARRAELAANGQEPLATILACSDSRDPVELIFDRGVGDLFVVRVAGNVAGISETATIEYGVTHLGTPILVVMGHTKCGAVTAVVKGAELHGHLAALAKLIEPAAKKAKGDGTSAEEAIPVAIQLNVWQQIESILVSSPLVRAQAVAGKVDVQGAVYDIASGKVVWLGRHPDMERLLATPAPEEHAAPAGLSDAHAPETGHGTVAAAPAAEAPHGDSHAPAAKHGESATAKPAGPMASSKTVAPAHGAPTSNAAGSPAVKPAGKNPNGPPPAPEPHDDHAPAKATKAH